MKLPVRVSRTPVVVAGGKEHSTLFWLSRHRTGAEPRAHVAHLIERTCLLEVLLDRHLAELSARVHSMEDPEMRDELLRLTMKELKTVQGQLAEERRKVRLGSQSLTSLVNLATESSSESRRWDTRRSRESG